MRRMLAVVMLLCACRTAAPPAPPSPPQTPPPPVRYERAARVTGTVTDSAGAPVLQASVTAWPADISCNITGQPNQRSSNSEGRYMIEVETTAGPDIPGCVVVEASAGGSTVRGQAAVTFSNSPVPQTARIDLTLPDPSVLDRAEADRIISLLAAALRAHDVEPEMARYLRVEPQFVRGVLDDYRMLLRGVTSTEFVRSDSRSFTYLLRGANGQTVSTTVRQDPLRRVSSPLIDAGIRARTLLNHLGQALEAGDIARVAAVMEASEARARDFSDRYAAARDRTFRLFEVDEVSQTLRYRAGYSDLALNIGYADDRVWIRN